MLQLLTANTLVPCRRVPWSDFNRRSGRHYRFPSSAGQPHVITWEYSKSNQWDSFWLFFFFHHPTNLLPIFLFIFFFASKCGARLLNLVYLGKFHGNNRLVWKWWIIAWDGPNLEIWQLLSYSLLGTPILNYVILAFLNSWLLLRMYFFIKKKYINITHSILINAYGCSLLQAGEQRSTKSQKRSFEPWRKQKSVSKNHN
jgi:hypothetical protein